MKFKEVLLLFVMCFMCSGRGLSDYAPWDELYDDSWILFLGNEPNMYPLNAPDNNDIFISYPVSFAQAQTGDKASGMNALKFIHGGVMEGHLVSKDKAGSFKVANTGNSNFFTDILLLLAIDVDSLNSDFSMSLNLAGQSPYVIDANDFVYYDSPHGRPSGFYSITDPNIDPIAYAFDTAMVCVYGVSGLTALEPTDPDFPEHENEITIEYSFKYVPAPVVFSVYGYVDNPGGDSSVYHTNRAFIDVNNPSKKVSTFAVTVDGDLNEDLKVDLVDFAIMSEKWLTGVR
jgi:hypothetical protein